MRVMLDVHPMIRCGPETHILPRLLMQLSAFNIGFNRKRLIKAGLYPKAINEAYAAFIHTLIRLAGEDAPVLCNKDPLTLKFISDLSAIIPTAKFILMVRDGRAVVNSLVRRAIRIGPNILTPMDMFIRWENITWGMLKQCDSLGPATCHMLRYEDLVLRPQEQMRQVLGFIGVPWDPIVLRHATTLGESTVLNS
ncbi:Tyrosine sulfotransferase 1 [Fasciola gigantica]|uniref:Protein-tyrosine sulfotransferase n=1 Tax=Fasciola gigantica TaxID=46835 RepID=A0A504YH51_FASGI|nr:Tyrosine sulfotransferase 1 [Fasciola gigantica]